MAMEEREVEKLAHGTGITLAGGAANSGFNYLAGMAISRFVGPELVGAYFLCLVWMQLASSFARLGFSDALLRFVPPSRLRDDEAERLRVMKTTLLVGGGVGLATGAILALGLGLLGERLGVEPLLRGYLPWFLLLVPAHVLMVLLLMAVQAHQDMSPVVLVRDVLQPGLLCAITVGLLLLIPERPALIGGVGISLLIAIFVIGIRVRRLARGIGAARGWMHFAPLFAFSIPAMLGDVSHYLYRWVDTITISVFLDLTEVGIYNAAVRTSLLIGLIFMAANAIYSTMASGYFHTGRGDQLRSALHLSTRWCMTLALPIGVVFLVAAEQVLWLWGPDFTRGAEVLKLLVFAQLLAVPTGILAYTLLMCEKQVLELADTLVCLGLIVALNLLLIPLNGLMGAAQALLLANATGLGLRWVQVHRSFGFHPFDRRIVKPLLAGVLASGAALLARAPVTETLAGLLGGPGSLATVLASLAVLGLLVLLVFLATQLVLGFEDEDRAIPGMLLERLRGTEPTRPGGSGGASPRDE